MKKLIIIATKIQDGRGGVSSALAAYLNGLDRQGADYELVVSHGDDKNIFVMWLKSLWLIACLSYKYRGGKAVFWFHCAQWLSLLRKFSLALIPRVFGCKTLGHIHSITFNGYLNGGVGKRLLTKVSLLPYSHLVMLTPWWQNILKQHGVEKSSIISPNPNSDRYCQVAQSYLDEKKVTNNKQTLTILTMTRLIEGKGVEVVIEALARLPDEFQLVIAGDGNKKNELMALVSKLKLDERVCFTGWVDGNQKEALLKEADIFCLPSSYDSFGMVFIEAMAFDLPVIAYSWGPIADVVTPDVGICCSAPTVDEVHAAVIDVANDLTRFSGNGPKKVLTQYNADIASKKIIDLLK